jgi:pimeloyl-ACP methyl ester carboxylesterase
MPELTRPDGCRLNYEVHGSPAATALLLLEGSGGDIPGWRRNIPHLSARHLVIALDSRGNGLSDAPDAPMAMATFVDDALAVVEAVTGDRPHVYGQSFGGMVALELALTHPDRVRSIVLAATHAGSARASRPGRDANVPKGKRYLALYSEAFAREHPEHVADDLRVGAQQPQAPHAGRRQWEAMRAWDRWDDLGRVRVPTLVLHGTEDRVVAVENARRLSAAIPGARLALLDGAGHVYHSERADEADRVVLAFLDEVEEAA